MTASGGPLAALGLTAPVVQAPIGSASTPELAAAVSGAGGLGTLALSWLRPAQVRDRLRATRELTPRPFGANLVLAWPQFERLAACLQERVAVVSTFWGDPGPYVEQVHAGGALHVHTVGSVDEARQAVAAGVDVIVAQGWEAGGHVRGTVSTLALVPMVVDAVHPVPVLAAGGIADGRGLAAALALGAAAGWVGTAFLLADEASAHPDYQARIAAAQSGDTVHSALFDGGWPDAPHRTLRNSTIDAWERAGRPRPGSRPGEGDVVVTARNGAAVPRYSDVMPTPGMVGDVEPMALYAGQGVGLVRERAPAAEITRRLVAEARRVQAPGA